MTGDRIDRERLRSLGLSSDSLPPPRPLSVARQLVQVYDGGSLPGSGDKVFLTRPATIDFSEAEGQTWSATADGGVSIPVVVLGSRAPSAGDLLVAHAVGGRWVAESRGGGVPSSCTTCLGSPLPSQLYLTDANGTITLAYVSGVSYFGGYDLSVSGVTSATYDSFGGYCTFTTGTASLTVTYSATCISGTGGAPAKLTVVRVWRIIYTGTPSDQQTYCSAHASFPSSPWTYCDKSIAVGTCCGSPGNPTGSHDQSSLTSAISSCGPLAWSGTLVAPGGNYTADPVGGSVTVTT